MLQVLGVFPELALPAYLISGGWMFFAMVTAVKHALDYRSTLRALVVCFIGAGLCLAVAIALALLMTRTAS